jgi:hypothetical protein
LIVLAKVPLGQVLTHFLYVVTVESRKASFNPEVVHEEHLSAKSAQFTHKTLQRTQTDELVTGP